MIANEADRADFGHIGAMKHLLSRRHVVCLLAGGGGLLSIPRSAHTAAAAQLAPGDPAAAALGYVEDAAKVDRRKYPTFMPGSLCENCLQLQGKAGANYRPCELFPGKLVAVKGWCSGWAAEM